MEEKKPPSESDMTGTLELSDQEFKTTIIDVLKAVMEKVDSMQEQRSNVSRGMEILRKNPKKNGRDRK